jgi:hypothetical protein
MDYRGTCHCGAIGFSYTTELEPARWPIRACQCSFCRAHGARYTSDPRGTVRFEIHRPELLQRYRFGQLSADFLLCRACGICIGAETPEPPTGFGVINTNALADPPALPPSEPSTYDGETEDIRRDRRTSRWSPLS